ncbi:hypothetical protein G7046_g5293 [Stylonectria norvegica]|nr:hypothetical protein G7046_g5293 [Stylonectria norvegica]
MSSVAVETAAHIIGGREAMALSRSYTTWAPDPYAPRDHTYQPQDQLRQSMRLPPPASLVAGSTGACDDTQFRTPQYQPRPSYAYEDPYASTSPTHLSHPPPQQQSSLPQNHDMAITSEQQRRHDQEVQRSMSFPSHASNGPERFQDRRMTTFEPNRSAPEPLPTPFSYAQGPSHSDVRFEPRLDHQQPQQPPLASPMDAMLPPESPARTRWPRSETRPEAIKISDLLSGGRTSGRNDVEYKLQIRQQPVAARSCGFGERDRRVIDPPPIVQLVIEAPSLSKEEISTKLRYGHYVMSCSIYDESGGRDASFMPEEYRQQRRLMGSLVGAPFVGQDENGSEGCFFCFPDLSCRTPGTFRLKFSLVMIDPVRAREVKHFPVLIEAKSAIFTVYNAKDFPGMQASTRLTKRLKEQGCIISIKKGNDKSKNPRTIGDLSDGEHEEGGSTQGKKKRRSVRR